MSDRIRTILAFESSCDDTAVAIVREDGVVLSNVVYSQVKEFSAYLGVVPEIGSRSHVEQILHCSKKAFQNANLSPKDIDVVAATFAPGLLGPLLVGAQFAKGFALAQKVPLIAVHHIVGHVLSAYSEEKFPRPPFLALIASGGHSALYLCSENFDISVIGESLDDAAGEAFDKIGRALGLGYPAGKIIDELAQKGDASRFSFPIAMRNESHFNFSFSGLKTHAIERIKLLSPFDEKTLHDFCASLQEAIAVALVERSIRALKTYCLRNLVIGGGVAANSRLRELLAQECQKQAIDVFLPQKSLCTDNAVMIARAAIPKLKQGLYSELSIDVSARLRVEEAALLTKNFID
jgi:N6-L-threonylcarbamoyladenine synthase